MQIKGLIEKKETKSTDTWTRGSFKIGNLFLSTFDVEIISKFNEGDFVEIEYEQSGKYNNITTCKKVEGEKLATIKEEIKKEGNQGNASYLMSYVKDIMCSAIEHKENVEIDTLMPLITTAVLNSYNDIIKGL